MATFIPGKVNASRRRAAMQAATFAARVNRLARVKANAAPAIATTITMRTNGGNQYTSYNTTPTNLTNGDFTSNSAAFSLATKWAFSVNDSSSKSVTAFYDNILAKIGAGKTATVTCTGKTEAGTFVFTITGLDHQNANGYYFNTHYVSASGGFNFHDVFDITVAFT